MVATEDSLLFWGSRPLLQSTISCPISNHSNHSSKNTELSTRKHSTNSSISPPPSSSRRELRNSSSVPDGVLLSPSDGDDGVVTPFLLQCKSVNDANRTMITDSSQYGQRLTNILEANDTKKHPSTMETSASINEWKKVLFSSHALQFCTVNGVALDPISSEITKLKVEGIACYGCNLLVLAEGQVAIAPTGTTNNILANPITETTVAGTSSHTPFVMGRRLARESAFRRMDSRYICHRVHSKDTLYITFRKLLYAHIF